MFLALVRPADDLALEVAGGGDDDNASESAAQRQQPFQALGFLKPEARSLALRSQIMIRIEEFVERNGMTRARAATRLGLTQPRLNALLKGKINQFSLDALMSAAARAGLQVDLLAPKGVGARAVANA